MKVSFPQSVTIIELEKAPFKNAKDADEWARSHGILGLMSDVDTHGKGEISISANSLNKMLSGSALAKSVTPAIHYAALMRLRDIIRESFVAEIHPDFKKVNGKRSPDNGTNPFVQIAVLYGCVSYGDIPYRAKSTLKLYRDSHNPTKTYSYEISNIEILTDATTLHGIKTSMDLSLLLNGVTDATGNPLLKKAETLRGTAAHIAQPNCSVSTS